MRGMSRVSVVREVENYIKQKMVVGPCDMHVGLLTKACGSYIVTYVMCSWEEVSSRSSFIVILKWSLDFRTLLNRERL